MRQSVIKSLADIFLVRGYRRQEFVLTASALLVAWQEGRDDDDVKGLFQKLSARLADSSEHSGIKFAAEWLEDPELTSDAWDALEAGLAFLRKARPGPIDWTAEFEACIAYDRQTPFGFNFALPLARSVTRVLDIPISETCACLFPGSASLAWVLSSDREVRFFASDRYIGIVVALMARAACRSLVVDIRNPISGSYSPAYDMLDQPERIPPFGAVDHIVSVPHFGMRVNQGPARGMPFESYQLERLAGHARKSFSTIITDGTLFRDNKAESSLRAKLVDQYATTVLSLPSGMFWPVSGVATSLLRLEPPAGHDLKMIDARSMDKSSTGRVQENMIVRHLDQFNGFRPKDASRVASVSRDEFANSNFSLLPERYVRSEGLALIETMIKEARHVTLEEVAVVERSKAPVPIREPLENPPISALEIAPADVVDGVVGEPQRRQGFDQDQEAAVARVTVKPNDILVSIKGNVGNIGIVDGAASDVSALLDEPWVISQSLAIIRWKPNPHIPSPELLNALLTAPWVREKLESMSGGTAVRTLPMSAVRSLTLPVPTAEECDDAEHQLQQIATVRKKIAEFSDSLHDAKSALWHQLWHLPPDLEVE